jgi:hypothetical protein
MNQQAMRNGQNNKRMRGRNNRKGQNSLTRVYESNGPDVKIRGTASHVADKYVQLARDAQSSGDPVAAENYYQHAEHYFRLIAAMQEQFRQTPPFFGDQRDGGYDDGDDDPADGFAGEPYAPQQPQQQQPQQQQPFQQREQPQPYQQRESRGGYQGREQRFEQQPQPYPPRQQPNGEEGGDVERLPAFVTGGGPQPAPQGQAVNGQNGPNGYEGSPDRFPLHRRRRRRHGPRGEGPMAGGEGDAPPPPRPPGE